MKKVVMILLLMVAWVVTMNDGTVYKGKIIKTDIKSYQRQDSIILVLEHGVEITMPWDSIKSIERVD